MALKLTSPIYESFTLDKSDEKYGAETSTTVTVRQARQHEHARRENLWSVIEQKVSQIDANELTYVQRFSMAELARLETYLCLCSCDIESEDGTPLFPSKKGDQDRPKLDMTEQQFNQAWGLLLPDIAKEIHEKILAVNPQWRGKEGEG